MNAQPRSSFLDLNRFTVEFILLTGLGLVAALLASGCATPIVTGDGRSTAVVTTTVPLSGGILVLAPKIRFEDARTEAELPGEMHAGPQVAEALAGGALESLRKAGAGSVALAEGFELPPEQRLRAEQIAMSANRVFLSTPDESVVQRIRLLNQPGLSAVLFQFVRVKAGPGGFWDPNSGMILSPASTSHFRVALVSSHDGRILWQNSMVLRAAPQPDSPDLTKVIHQLYSTLSIQSSLLP